MTRTACARVFGFGVASPPSPASSDEVFIADVGSSMTLQSFPSLVRTGLGVFTPFASRCRIIAHWHSKNAGISDSTPLCTLSAYAAAPGPVVVA